MTEQSQTKERACFICSRDTMDGAYPALILGINAARLGLAFECGTDTMTTDHEII